MMNYHIIIILTLREPRVFILIFLKNGVIFIKMFYTQLENLKLKRRASSLCCAMPILIQ